MSARQRCLPSALTEPIRLGEIAYAFQHGVDDIGGGPCKSLGRGKLGYTHHVLEHGALIAAGGEKFISTGPREHSQSFMLTLSPIVRTEL